MALEAQISWSRTNSSHIECYWAGNKQQLWLVAPNYTKQDRYKEMQQNKSNQSTIASGFME
jgi:hypothetical protein